LLEAPRPEFDRIVEVIRHEFPKLKEWFDWWLRDDHAPMLFESRKSMDPILWKSLPSTTNAEEAMHFSFYQQQGKQHDFLEGFKALKKIADTFELKYRATSGNILSSSMIVYLPFDFQSASVLIGGGRVHYKGVSATQRLLESQNDLLPKRKLQREKLAKHAMMVVPKMILAFLNEMMMMIFMLWNEELVVNHRSMVII